MNNLKEKCDAMNFSITKFLAKYTMLRQAGIPDIHVFNEKLMDQKQYDKKIRDHAKEQVNKPLPQGSPTGKVVLQYIEDLFFLQNEIKHLFVIKTKFSKHTDADESFRKLKSVRIPDAEQWQDFTDLLQQQRSRTMKESAGETFNLRRKQ